MKKISSKSIYAGNLLLLSILSACGGSGTEEGASARVSVIESSDDAGINDRAEQFEVSEGSTVSSEDNLEVPTTPRSLNALANQDGTVSVIWANSDKEVNLQSYNLWRDGQPLHSVNGSVSTYIDDAVGSGVRYTYQISATGKNGKTSPLSTERSVKTLEVAQEDVQEKISVDVGLLNQSTAAAKAGHMTKAGADVLPPTSPTDLVVGVRSSSSLTLNWRESSDNVGVVGYNVYKNSTWVGGTSARDFVFNSLTPGVRYDLSVRSYDAVGNQSPPSKVTATTSGAAVPVDVVSPTVPSALTTGAVSSSSIVIKWNASTDASGVAGYELYLNGVFVGDVTRQLSYTFGALKPNTRYQFSVKAFDAAGNKSPLSTPIFAKTAAASSAMTAKLSADKIVIEGKNPWTENPMMFWDDVSAAFQASGLPLGSEVPVGPGQMYRAGTPSLPSLMTSHFKYQRTSETRSGEVGVVYAGVGPKPILSYPEYNGPARTFNKMYVSWWYKPSISPGAEGASNKFVRFWDDGNGKGTRVSWTQMHLTCTVPVDYEPEVSWGTWWENGGIAGKWNRHEVELDLSVPRVRNWVNGVAGHNHPCVKHPAYSEKPIALGLIGFDHGGYDNGGGDKGYNYQTMKTSIDDIYISNSPARVELSDSPTWSGAGQREVLPVKSWAPTKIELGQVRGVLKATTKLYVYVVAPNGSVNANGIPLN
ncbi:MAG: fibronectin type III domain-containing protein [Acidovorax sp.]|nr:fibronectin type III domain-containing protein [Acidovorax sp.]